MPDSPITAEQFAVFVAAARMGVVATADPDGQPEAALVDLAVSPDGELVFDTLATARKTANIAGNPRVALVIGCAGGVSVQVEGTAAVLSGAERERYGLLYAAQFPGSRVLQDQFAVVRVTPRWLRYYDARPESFQVAEGCWPPAD